MNIGRPISKSPQGLVSALPGTILSTLFGLFYKKTGTDSTGWKLLATSEEVQSRAPVQSLWMDGTSAGSFTLASLIGTGDYTVALKACARALTNNINLFDIYGDKMQIKFSGSSGALFFVEAGHGGYVSPNGTLEVDKWADIVATRSAGTTSLYKNGLLLGTAVQGCDINTTLCGLGKNTYYNDYEFNGSIRLIGVLNRALSAAEVLALYDAGAVPATDINSASNTSLVTGDNSTFASNTGFWALDNGSTISGGTLNCAANAQGIYSGTLALKKGRRYKFVFTVVSSTGGALVQYYNGGGYVPVAGTNVAGTYSVEFTADGDYFLVIHQSGGGTLQLDNVLFYNLGLLCSPEQNAPGVGLVWNDQSGNGVHIVLPSTGVIWNLPGNGENEIRFSTNTNGNQQLLGASVLPVGAVITEVHARSVGGDSTATLGYTSGTAGVVASATINSSFKLQTLATGGYAIASILGLWANSNSTNRIDWVIRWKLLRNG